MAVSLWIVIAASASMVTPKETTNNDNTQSINLSLSLRTQSLTHSACVLNHSLTQLAYSITHSPSLFNAPRIFYDLALLSGMVTRTFVKLPSGSVGSSTNSHIKWDTSSEHVVLTAVVSDLGRGMVEHVLPGCIQHNFPAIIATKQSLLG